MHARMLRSGRSAHSNKKTLTLIIRKPGILTTIQDLGRAGGRRFGINPGGVMDRAAASVVNTLLGNPDSAPVLELHFPAAEIEFEHEVTFAIGGGDFNAELDGQACRNWSVATGTRGSVLRFTGKLSGQRAYLAVSAGFAVDLWLDSASTNLTAGIGGFSGRALQVGDRLPCGGSTQISKFTAGNSLMSRYSGFPVVRVIAGPEYAFLTATSERTFLNETFAITADCNRMGYRMIGDPLHLLHEREMVSAAVNFGTVQLLPDGQVIVLMADHQTSGGYPRIANVISVDLPLLAQCGPGDRVRFEQVTVYEAEYLASRFERELNFLRVGCRLQRQNASR